MGSVDGMARHAAAPRTWLHLPRGRRRRLGTRGRMASSSASAPAEREMGGWSVGRGEVLDGGRCVDGRCPHVRRVVVSMLVGGGGEGGGWGRAAPAASARTKKWLSSGGWGGVGAERGGRGVVGSCALAPRPQPCACFEGVNRVCGVCCVSGEGLVVWLMFVGEGGMGAAMSRGSER